MTRAAVPRAIRETSMLDGRDVRKALSGLYASRTDAADPSLDIMADIVVLLSGLDLGTLEPTQLDSKNHSLRQAVRRIFGQGAGRSERKDATCEIEHLQGGGLGSRIDLSEGRERLRRRVTASPLERWAGPVAGAGEIERRIGIPRSTLSNWRARKTAIGLLRGERKLAYPLDQFIDARPVGGLAEVLDVAPDERAAWLWLTQPHPALGGRSPLHALRTGQRQRVADAAGRDFAIERDLAAP